MSQPLEVFEIELPSGVDEAVQDSLEDRLAATCGVEKCGRTESRSLDPSSFTTWVPLLSAVVTTAVATVPMVKRILELFKSKGI
jgi:hypothetical protein